MEQEPFTSWLLLLDTPLSDSHPLIGYLLDIRHWSRWLQAHLVNPHKGGVIIPIFQIGKLRLREAPNHTVDEWRSQDPNTGLVILSQCIILVIQGPSCTRNRTSTEVIQGKSVFLSGENLRWSATWKPRSNLELALKCLPEHIFPRYCQNLIRKSDKACDHPELCPEREPEGAKGRLFSPDWAQAEKATEERSVIRATSSLRESRGEPSWQAWVPRPIVSYIKK